MDSRFLAAALEKNAGKVGGRLSAYLQNPDDGESVHDVRTSLRRLEAAFSLMPKKARRKNRAQIKAYKEFFRANSRVRDYDVIREKLEGAAAGLEKKRKVELLRALRLARAVQELPALDTRINNDKLDARVDRVASRLLSSIKKRLPAALADREEKEELHELRKDLKKLRYVLEILPAGSRKDYEIKLAGLIKARGPVTARLKELQDLTGSIHDCDIAIDYLKSVRKAGAILQKQMAERDGLFDKFARMFS
ncbi:MAG: CHAD domain-containing protein [Nitrososphaera sp.]|uniref:CHAD domain-containing protein n=1 Tax=Nitrososphaera sp. TaxID=1971748 RepID=UPI003D6E7BC4